MLSYQKNEIKQRKRAVCDTSPTLDYMLVSISFQDEKFWHKLVLIEENKFKVTLPAKITSHPEFKYMEGTTS